MFRSKIRTLALCAFSKSNFGLTFNYLCLKSLPTGVLYSSTLSWTTRPTTSTSISSLAFFTTMSKQASISSFFQPKPSKRSAATDSSNVGDKKVKLGGDDLAHCNKTPPKKQPLAENNTSPNSSDKPTPLSPEQKSQIDTKRLNAKMTLVSNNTKGLVNNMGCSWFQALESEFSKPYFLQLSNFLASERSRHTVYPPASQVFSWTQQCDIKNVKVVILGQDPYHGPNQAHGLCFSVQPGVACPPSLVNMYKELATDIEGFKAPGHGCLSGWDAQGVLLLNAVLTVQAHNANSHKDKGWEKFTDAVISWINSNHRGVVFMLWGSYAQKKGKCVDEKKHHVLRGVHPSPLSAHRGFFGCKHFSKCNKLLSEQGKTPINWTHLPV